MTDPSSIAPTVASEEIVAEFRGVTKRYGAAAAVDDLYLEIKQGEFLSLLGPSGCGKTTTLRMLGGFASPDVGEIRIQGEDVTGIPPYKRSVNTVFQSYALFGHLNVWNNVAFGLKRNRVDRDEIRRRVGEVLELVHLSARSKAMPSELSGGQQQRVALARALVNRPAVLLLDEPLGALDLQLRRAMQVELKALQRELGTTFVFVTHDQEEALSMSDRIGVMHDGRLEQLGGASEIYGNPANSFVAGFIGLSNLIPAVVDGGVARVKALLSIPLTAEQSRGLGSGEQVTLSLRPEALLLGEPRREGVMSLPVDVIDVSYLGSTTKILLDAGQGLRLTVVEITAGFESRLDPPSRGQRTSVSWRPSDIQVLSGGPLIVAPSDPADPSSDEGGLNG